MSADYHELQAEQVAKKLLEGQAVSADDFGTSTAVYQLVRQKLSLAGHDDLYLYAQGNNAYFQLTKDLAFPAPGGSSPQSAPLNQKFNNALTDSIDTYNSANEVGRSFIDRMKNERNGLLNMQTDRTGYELTAIDKGNLLYASGVEPDRVDAFFRMYISQNLTAVDRGNMSEEDLAANKAYFQSRFELSTSDEERERVRMEFQTFAKDVKFGRSLVFQAQAYGSPEMRKEIEGDYKRAAQCAFHSIQIHDDPDSENVRVSAEDSACKTGLSPLVLNR